MVFKTKVMSKKIVKNGLVLIPFEELEDEFFGEKGTSSRKQYDLEVKLDLIGEALKAARKSRNLTQQELGDMVGVGKAQISKLEKSTGNTTFATVVRVFNALGAKVKLRIELENDSEVVLQ